MKTRSAFFFIAAIIVFACPNCNNATKKNFPKNSMEINQIVKGKVFIVKDSSKYSSEFLNELRELSSIYDTLKLIEDNVIIKSLSGGGVTLIPSLIPLNVYVNYKAIKNDKKYILTLRRINFTNIEYALKISENTIVSGQVSLPGGFILGDETITDENGEVIGAIEYRANNECRTILRIDSDSGTKVSFEVLSENDKSKEISEVPILIKE
jgi:hypothetical protein